MEKRSKITLLASDESSAPLYRVRLLAKLLAKRYEVEVVGFQFGEIEENAPRDFDYFGLPAREDLSFIGEARKMRGLLDGDLIYAMKPRPTSLGLALWHRKKTGIPVAVDVDDDELCMTHPFSKHRLKNFIYGLPKLNSPNCFPYTWALDPFVRKADAVTVVSEHFRKRYGGQLLYQHVDTTTFDPGLFDRDGIRREEGLGNIFTIAFAGIALPNKGVGEILQAMESNWRLWIIGPKTPYAYHLAAQDRRVVLLGTRAPWEIPRFLAAADLVVLPQRKVPHSEGQMPIKLFEAMAMGKPIVATGLADIPKVLEGCGLVVRPEDPGALRGAIKLLARSPEFARILGAAARKRCVAEYSWERGVELLSQSFDPLIERNKK